MTTPGTDYIGLSEDEATTHAINGGYHVRITRRDGNYLTVTRDYRADRINFTVQAQIVTQANVG